jgi:protoporphyrinogen oxidase
MNVAVLERAGRVGGAAGSFDVHGVRVDFGSHRLHPSIDPVILADLRSALGDDLQKRTRNGRIRLMERWIAFPLSMSDVVRRMPRSFVAGAVGDALSGPLRRPRADTFADVLRAGLGPTICERFYFPYARKIWGVEPEELSGEQARRRVSANGPLKIAARVVSGSGSGGERGSSTFWYPKRGYGQISEALAARAESLGATIELRRAASSIRVDDERVEVRVDDGKYEARRVFSTIPLTVLSRLLQAPPEVEEAAAKLRFRSMILVYLVLDVARYTTFDAHYLSEPYTPVTRVSEPKNYRDGDDPPNRTVLCAEVPCDTSDPLWDASNEELSGIVIQGLRDSGAPDADPCDVHVERLPFAYPIYDVGYERRFEVIDRWVSSHDRVLSFGRQGLFAHDNAHHALSMSYAAVDALRADGSFDAAAWRRAREGFTRHIVED